MLLCQRFQVGRNRGIGMEAMEHPAWAGDPSVGIVKLAGMRMAEYVLVGEREAHDGVCGRSQGLGRLAADHGIPPKLKGTSKRGHLLRDLPCRERVTHHGARAWWMWYAGLDTRGRRHQCPTNVQRDAGAAVLEVDRLAGVEVLEVEGLLAVVHGHLKRIERVQIGALARFQALFRLLPTLTRVSRIVPEGYEPDNGERDCADGGCAQQDIGQDNGDAHAVLLRVLKWLLASGDAVIQCGTGRYGVSSAHLNC